jgi:hypothetical protein
LLAQYRAYQAENAGYGAPLPVDLLMLAPSMQTAKLGQFVSLGNGTYYNTVTGKYQDVTGNVRGNTPDVVINATTWANAADAYNQALQLKQLLAANPEFATPAPPAPTVTRIARVPAPAPTTAPTVTRPTSTPTPAPPPAPVVVAPVWNPPAAVVPTTSTRPASTPGTSPASPADDSALLPASSGTWTAASATTTSTNTRTVDNLIAQAKALPWYVWVLVAAGGYFALRSER